MGTTCMPVRRGALLQPQEQAVWKAMLSTPLDTRHSRLVLELQRTEADLDGSFLAPRALGALVLELKRFLFLSWLRRHRCPTESRMIAPSPSVDRAWKALASFTQLYRTFCFKFFGTLLHRDTEEVQDLDNYSYTLQLYSRVFGPPSPLYWPRLHTIPAFRLAHQSYLRMQTIDFEAFIARFQREHENAKPADLLTAMTRAIDRQRALLLELNESQCQRDRKRESEEIQAERAPFGSFAKLDRMAYSQRDLRLPSSLADSEEPRALSFCEASINLLPAPSQHFSKKSGIPRDLHKDTDRTIRTASGGTALHPDWKKIARALGEELEVEELSPLVEKCFMRETASSMATTNMVFREYKRYLLLVSLAGEGHRFVGSRMVGLMWEYHAVETQEYQGFCERMFSRVLPVQHYSREEALLEDYKRTLEMYELVFRAEPPQSIWESFEVRASQGLGAGKFYNPRLALEILRSRRKAFQDEEKRRLRVCQDCERALAAMQVTE